jgi:hypothetical protein
MRLGTHLGSESAEPEGKPTALASAFGNYGGAAEHEDLLSPDGRRRDEPKLRLSKEHVKRQIRR